MLINVLKNVAKYTTKDFGAGNVLNCIMNIQKGNVVCFNSSIFFLNIKLFSQVIPILPAENIL